MNKLGGFQYATALDLNMGYYTIRISIARQDMTTIFTKFGKFIYNCLPMGMCALGDIFQDKVDELLGDTEGAKAYIYDIIVLSKNFLIKYTEQPIMIFGILRASGLKVNAPAAVLG